MLTTEQMEKLSYIRLRTYFYSIRGKCSYIEHYYGRRCCEICHEYIGNDWENDVRQWMIPYEEHIKLIKPILYRKRLEYERVKSKSGSCPGSYAKA